MIRLFLMVCVVVSGAACASDAAATHDDSAPSASADAGEQLPPPPGEESVPLPNACEQGCADTSLRVMAADGRELALPAVAFGVRTAAFPELLLRASSEPGSACEAAKGAAAQQPVALTLHALPVPYSTAQIQTEDGVEGELLDPDAQILPHGVARARVLEGELWPIAAGLGEARTLSYVAFDVELRLEGGLRVSGHVFAEHCTGLDR